MNEHKYWDSLRSDSALFPKIVKLYKIPGGAGAAGLCDLIWVCYAGNYWVELKWVNIPSKADTPVFLRKITTDLQYHNLVTVFNINGMAAMIVGFEWSGNKYARVFSPHELDNPFYYFPDLYKCVCKPRGGAWDFEKFNGLLHGITKVRWGA